MYIVIEGQDGTGKSTQAELLKKHYEKMGKEVVILEEPDGDLPQAHDLHDMILARGYNLEPLTNVLLFTAARVELWQKIAEPVLRRGGIVISAHYIIHGVSAVFRYIDRIIISCKQSAYRSGHIVVIFRKQYLHARLHFL